MALGTGGKRRRARTAEDLERREIVVGIGCIACRLNMTRLAGLGYRYTGQACEWDHLNEGGNHGGRRIGDEATIGLCLWHHRAQLPNGFTTRKAEATFGPSWASSPNGFRSTYGTRDALLVEVNRLVAAYDFTGL